MERSFTINPTGSRAGASHYCRWFRRISLTGVLLLCASFPALAQTIRGTVIEELSHRPVAGGLVQLLDASRISASVVTDEQGRFLLAEIVPGQYRVRVLRIGFRPWSSDSLLIAAGADRRLTLIVPAVPVLLDEITVEGTSACRATPEADRRVALLWDQARTSLGLLGGGRTDLDYRVTVTRRRRDTTGRVNGLEVLPTVGQGAWPVTSQPAESLAQLGFVQPADTLAGPIYYGPDVAVFFSDAFLQTHCFRLVAPKGQPSLLGVGFEPVRGRTLPDIEGTLWLDRRTGLLLRLEYRYTSLWHWVPRDAAGGSLDFSRLRNGTPIISGWNLKAPVARRLPWRRPGEAGWRQFFGQADVTFGGWREEEAVVTEVLSPEGAAVWKRPPAGEAPPSTTARPTRR